MVGLPTELTPKLLELPEKEGFSHLIKGKKNDISELREQLLETESKEKKVYKEIAMEYLEAMDQFFDFSEFYTEKLYEAYVKLVQEAKQIDREIRDEYIVLNAKINSAEEKEAEDLERLAILDRKYTAHTSLLNSLMKWNLSLSDIEDPSGAMKKLKHKNASKVFEMYRNEKPQEDIIKFLELKLADLFHKTTPE